MHLTAELNLLPINWIISLFCVHKIYVFQMQINNNNNDDVIISLLENTTNCR